VCDEYARAGLEKIFDKVPFIKIPPASTFLAKTLMRERVFPAF
jgi:hypothetical protein